MAKRYSETDVLTAARERIAYTFAHFSKVYVSFSGGKDSTVMLNLAVEEARRLGRLPLDVLIVDLEAQYFHTVDFIKRTVRDLGDDIRPHWICLPLNLRNAVSQLEPHWTCWDPEAKDRWVRKLPTERGVVSDPAAYPFFRHRMEFEDFVPAFGEWFADGETTACLVGIRSDESLNRFRTVVDREAIDPETGETRRRRNVQRYDGKNWTVKQTDHVFNVYPVYDWRTEDVWNAVGSFKWDYNRLYDLMHLAGVPVSQMRICQPFGDDQRKALKLWPRLEPETWPRIVARVQGANFGKDHATDALMGHRKIVRPDTHPTWRSYAEFLLSTQPKISRAQYEDKIAKHIAWWANHGFPDGTIPDEADPKLEADKKAPSWRRIAKCILRNDFWCKSLGFGMTKNIVLDYYDRLAADEEARNAGKPEGDGMESGIEVTRTSPAP